ncbi:Pyruvate/Phosphoenolpyruvate kinase-like domain-containing protein [Amylocarpus encephaloides]|uniref:Pyruvate/Phosphoenolpyruvate kinase-like domain-containing protein n=1 Tax=Amylocarpus encephaloides TaxID=45428 RepID=A0A9P8C6V6_9HELO|nr:Pyruvate/Phosphoenolpyruvate kinase-like domain-containing protein [Amylocarpus encephaloides]
MAAMKASNRLKMKMDEGQAFGCWQMAPGSNVSRTLARTGVDFVVVDCERDTESTSSDAAMHEAVPAIAACGVSPIVRIPDNQGYMVKRALDSGAHGVLVPLLYSVEDAKKLVRSAKFPPEGNRGFGSPFPQERFNPALGATDYLQQANESILTIVQIETKEALEDIDAIAMTPGIDVLFVGPFDLGNNIGYPILDGTMHENLQVAITKVLQAAKSAGKKAGIFCSNGVKCKIQPLSAESIFSVICSTENRCMSLRALDESSGFSSSFFAWRTSKMAQKCVHQSCTKQYTDPEEECHYHPGPPIFHEGQKGWKCCKPRVLNFDEFLSIPPCTTGKHSTTDHPPTIEKKQGGDDVSNAPVPITKPISTSAETSRGPISAPQRTATPPPPPESEDDDPSLEIAKGKICRRKGCGQSYTGDVREGEKCTFHPGGPIFHEGTKGFTCCKRRVLEFDEFMKIEGCKTKDRHLFIGNGDKKAAKLGGGGLLETVRYDFYQTATSAIGSFFLKKINKETAVVEFSDNELTLDLSTTDATPKRYKAVIPLFGPIDTKASTFKILGTKLEVNFVKADGSSWPVLRSDEPVKEIIQVGKAGRAV